VSLPPYLQGQDVARAGRPYTDCPFPKPELPSQGERYPGDWANWISGWLFVRNNTGHLEAEVRAELHALIMDGLRATRGGAYIAG